MTNHGPHLSKALDTRILIEISHIRNNPRTGGLHPPGTRPSVPPWEGFECILRGELVHPTDHGPPHALDYAIPAPPCPYEAASNTPSKADAAGAYQKHEVAHERQSDWEKYKDDQLLSNPGGDHYDLGKKTVDSNTKAHESFWGRIGKDLSDTLGNLTNFFGNLFFGADTHYRDENNRIQTVKGKGVLGSIVDFFTDLGSGFSFGLWRPDGEKEPQGFLGRAGFFLSKMKEAIFGDLIQGASGSAIRAGENIILAGWNLVEVAPDATLGNWEEGRKLTTTFFDNGQVVIDYMTDIIPAGEAWLRVHAPNLDDLKDPKAPILYNIQLPERFEGDARWSRVRNTPFRKTIETIGSLLADIATVKLIGDMNWSSDRKQE